MTQHLVITAVGTDRPGICNEVVRLVTQAGCNIIDSRIAMFGKEFTLLMLISGSPSNITRVETTLPLLGQQHDLITMMKRTSPHDHQTHAYTVEIGMASLSAQTISKDKLHSEQNQFHIAISARVDSGCNLMQLQEEFDALCTALDVQGSLNFIKNSQ